MGSLADFTEMPRVVVMVFMIVTSIPTVVFLPLLDLQPELWATALVTFVGGDSITTSLLGEYGLEEGTGYTRWLCGARPSVICSFGTRILAFTGLFAVYLLVVEFNIGSQFQPLALAALSMPVVLAIGGFGATVVNSYGILQVRKRSSPD